jgi:hypothetical protein
LSSFIIVVLRHKANKKDTDPVNNWLHFAIVYQQTGKQGLAIINLSNLDKTIQARLSPD